MVKRQLSVLYTALALCAVAAIITALMYWSSRFHANGAGNASSHIQATSQLPAAVSQLPQGEGAWLVFIMAGGGMAGYVNGVVITSEGEVSTGKPARLDQYRWDCKAQLSPSNLKKFQQLVLQAHPSAWRGRYLDPDNPYIGGDQVGYVLELHRRQPDDTPKVYISGWYDTSSTYMLPKDLTVIQEAAVTIKINTLQQCLKEQSEVESGESRELCALLWRDH